MAVTDVPETTAPAVPVKVNDVLLATERTVPTYAPPVEYNTVPGAISSKNAVLVPVTVVELVADVTVPVTAALLNVLASHTETVKELPRAPG